MKKYTPFDVKDLFAYQIAQLDRLIELEKQNAVMLEALKDLIMFEDCAAIDDHVPNELIGKVRALIADIEEGK